MPSVLSRGKSQVIAPAEHVGSDHQVTGIDVRAPGSHIRSLLRGAEHGSAEGGTFGDIAFIPLLTGLLMVGVFFALLGFWRVGASFATQRSADTGAVASGQGGASLVSYWSWWGGANPTGGGFVVTPGDRSVKSNVSTSFTFDYLGFGPWTLPINGQTQSRLERFYPGAPICVGQICGE